jgi:hypothetical protein
LPRLNSRRMMRRMTRRCTFVLLVVLVELLLVACGEGDGGGSGPLPTLMPTPTPVSASDFDAMVAAYTPISWDPTLPVTAQFAAIGWSVPEETVDQVINDLCQNSLGGVLLQVRLPGGDLKALPAMAGLLEEARQHCLILESRLNVIRGDIVYHLSVDPLDGLIDDMPDAHNEICEALQTGEDGITAAIKEIAGDHGGEGGLVWDLAVGAAVYACPFYIDDVIDLVDAEGPSGS